jgi:Protein of unknown function (DUF2849)
MEILVGNELASGASVYLDAAGRWIEALQQARLFGPEEIKERDDAIARSKATTRIVGIEIETVSVVDGTIVPDRLRERIRAVGSTAPVFEKQHLLEGYHVSI